MVQECEHFGFALELSETFLVSRDVRRQHLHRHLALQVRDALLGAVILPQKFVTRLLNAMPTLQSPWASASALQTTRPGVDRWVSIFRMSSVVPTGYGTGARINAPC